MASECATREKPAPRPTGVAPAGILSVVLLALIPLACAPFGAKPGEASVVPVWANAGHALADIAVAPRDGPAPDGTAVARTAGKMPAGFHIRLVNRGNVAGRIRLAEGRRDDGWAARYYDHSESGLDITEHMRGKGWYTPPLAPGDEMVLRMAVLPLKAAPGSEGRIRLNAFADNRASASAVTRVVATPEPKPYVGLQRTGETQWSDLVQGSVYDGEVLAGRVLIRNAGDAAGSLGLKLLGALDKWRVTLTAQDGADVTGEILAGKWAETLRAGEGRTLSYRVAPDGAQKGDRLRFLLMCGAGTVQYRAGLEARMQGRFQPRLFISEATRKIASVARDHRSVAIELNGETAAIRLRLVNDGDLPDRFLVTESGYDRRWAARYAVGGTDVTDAIRGLGWRTAALKPGEHVVLQLRVNSGSAPAKSGMVIHLKAVSSKCSTRDDSVLVGVRRAAAPATGGGIP